MVLDYGLNHLKIPNVIVFGHYNCGGVALAIQQAEVYYNLYQSKSVSDVRNPAEEYLDPIVRMIKENTDILSAIPDKYQRYDRVCELHCGFTVRSISEHPVVKPLFDSGNLCIYGIMYEYIFFILQSCKR